MTSDRLLVNAQEYLHKYCVQIDNRRVGSQGNHAATDHFSEVVSSFGFQTERPHFECIDWSQGGASLTAEGETFEVFPSPYSLGCNVRAPLEMISSVEDLEACQISGKIVLLQGEIAKEQLMPKNFPFYNPEEHQHIIQLLESKQPSAIIAATSRDVQMVGSQYPFPLFEDGDFNIPSVTMTDEEGLRLAGYVECEIALNIQAERIPATGCNVIARKGANADRRVVVFAHIDARMGTPGASDNASGVITLLLLAQLMQDYSGDLGIELVAINGEDYFSNPGEQLWMADNSGKFLEISLGINIDDVGYQRGKVAYSLYGLAPELDNLVRDMLGACSGLIEGQAWFQGDHSLFVMNQAPALAFTAEYLDELMAEFTHTPKDIPEIIDPQKLVDLAFVLRNLLEELNRFDHSKP